MKISKLYKNRAHYLYIFTRTIKGHVYKIINYSCAYWWGVKIGNGCKFQGKMYFNRIQNSEIRIGNNCTFNSSHNSNLIGVYSPCMVSTIKGGAKVKIGNGCGFSGTVIGAALHIELGDNVRCGANTLITDSDWHSDDYRTGDDKPVIIEDNVWLGYGVKVLKGVRIGKNSLIGANSVVTKDIPANVVAVGNPCRIIKQLEEKV